jgi:hypothetical protein
MIEQREKKAGKKTKEIGNKGKIGRPRRQIIIHEKEEEKFQNFEDFFKAIIVEYFC